VVEVGVDEVDVDDDMVLCRFNFGVFTRCFGLP